MTLTDLELENRLRDQRSRADEVPPTPVDLAQRVRARAREQRRRRVALTAAGVAAALVFLGLPALASGLLGDGSRGESATPSTTTRAPAPSHLDQPTRGSLADDEEWLAGVRALSWLPGDPAAAPPEVHLPDPAVEDRKVVFAGDVDGGRVALVMARAENRLVKAWFVGPERARPGDMRLATKPWAASGREPIALVAAPDPTSEAAVVVVVASPGDEAEVLTGREVSASGETREIWQPLVMEDGVGALALRRMVLPPGIDVRIARPDRQSPLFAQLEVGDEGSGSVAEPLARAVSDPRGLLGTVDVDELRWSLTYLVSYYGLTPDEPRPTLLAAGPVSPGSSTTVVLVGLTFPSGATMAQLVTTWGTGEEGMTTTTTLDPAPAGTALLDRLIAVATTNALTVSGPMAGATAELYRDDGTLVTTVPLVEGAGSVPLAPQARQPALALGTVRVLDGAGNVLAESAVEQPG